MLEMLVWRIKCALHVLRGEPLIYGCEFNEGINLSKVNSRVWIVGNLFKGEGNVDEWSIVRGVRDAIT